jgi:acetoin utilization deacetylase AcuC-like enzyme
MGFCIFNNVALAARWAMEKGALKRVAILDWDVHHGNGSQDIFWDEPRAFYASMHQHPFYPGTGAPRQRPNLLNVALEAGAGDTRALSVFKEKLFPALKAFDPELLLISCGFDAHAGDPLGQLEFSDSLYAELTHQACSLGSGRVVSVLEGGYNLEAIASAACAHVQALLEAP